MSENYSCFIELKDKAIMFRIGKFKNEFLEFTPLGHANAMSFLCNRGGRISVMYVAVFNYGAINSYNKNKVILHIIATCSTIIS